VFKNFKISSKIKFGFGMLLVFLIALVSINFFEWGHVDGNIHFFSKVSDIPLELEHRKIDHLIWFSNLSNYVFDPDIKKLDVQTNDQQCELGKFLFSDRRKEAEKALPELIPIFKAMEEPHRLLHETAIDIEKEYNKSGKEGQFSFA